MSAGILGALAGVGPGVTEGLNAREDRASSKSERVINEAKEGRDAEQHQWLKGFSERYKLRGMLEDPQQFQQWKAFASGAGPVAQQPAPAVPQNQYAIPGVAPVVNRMPGAADGGAMEVPQAQPQQALPQPQQQALPQPQQQAPVPQTTRRERYNDWYNDTARYAILTGGLEGYSKFQEMENATSRRQVMGYALQAVDALDKGMVGEAMRAGNAALEVTPFDTGLQFVAHNGELYMQGKDGKRSDKPLNADHLRAFTDQHMKTPESYLDWKKQHETERKNVVDEGIAQTNASSSRMVAEAQKETSKYAGQRADAATTQALASVISALGRRDAAAHARAGDLGWDPGQSVQIIKGANDYFMNEFEAITPEVDSYLNEHPQEKGKFKSDVSQLVLEQGPGRNGTNTLDYDKAAIISQLIRQPGGLDLQEHAPDFKVMRNKETGDVLAVYDGQRFRLPPSLKQDAIANFKLTEGGNTTSQNSPAMATDPMDPNYQWQQDAAALPVNERAAQMQADQEAERRRQATHS